MKYLGSKSKIAKHIVPVLQYFIDHYDVKTYIEPFVGGANIIDKINCKNRYGGDNNRYLIALLDHLKKGNELPDEMPREKYNMLRGCWRTHDEHYPNWLIGCAGFLASFNGRFFDGGYAATGVENGRTRDYYRESKDNITAQFGTGALDDVIFQWADYKYYSTFERAVIYCDPPYQGKKQYSNSKSFDYDEFWNWVRTMSRKNWVFVSEMQAPEDFSPVWEGEVNRSIKPTDKFTATEKLYRWDYDVSYTK